MLALFQRIASILLFIFNEKHKKCMKLCYFYAFRLLNIQLNKKNEFLNLGVDLTQKKTFNTHH